MLVKEYEELAILSASILVSMDPMDTMDPLDTIDPLDKNIKLMFADCVQRIHSNGSIVHPLDPLHMSIGHVHWTLGMDSMDPLDPLNTIRQLYRWTSCPVDVRWMSIGNDGSIGLD